MDRSERETTKVASSSGGGMQIYIKTLTGKTITIDVCICTYLFIY